MTANNTLFEHYSDFPMNEWRWPNFTPLEMACRGTGQLMVDFHSMNCLQALRDRVGKPIYINSAFRSVEHNEAVDGVPNSQHLLARAFDPNMRNHDPHLFEHTARECGFTSFGYYVDLGFMHIDTRDRPAEWGEPWPMPESDPPEILAKSAQDPDFQLGQRRKRPTFAPRG